jgi:hypothetical protein
MVNVPLLYRLGQQNRSGGKGLSLENRIWPRPQTTDIRARRNETMTTQDFDTLIYGRPDFRRDFETTFQRTGTTKHEMTEEEAKELNKRLNDLLKEIK